MGLAFARFLDLGGNPVTALRSPKLTALDGSRPWSASALECPTKARWQSCLEPKRKAQFRESSTPALKCRGAAVCGASLDGKRQSSWPARENRAALGAGHPGARQVFRGRVFGLRARCLLPNPACQYVCLRIESSRSDWRLRPTSHLTLLVERQSSRNFPLRSDSPRGILFMDPFNDPHNP